jgi:short-subunit dehydrogenase
MKANLKKLQDQVVVILGASSGIGLATAELAAEEGAQLVLASRSERAMNRIVGKFEARGVEAIYVPCDVSDRGQVEGVAKAATERFGRIDTWVNNAGLSIYGRLDEVTEQDSRRLFDVNFWGVVHGSLTALPYLRLHGGAIITVGSDVSESVVPLQGMYAASKQAVRAFTDALRSEVVRADHAPVSITLIHPGAVDTPFAQHARNYLPSEPSLPKPRLRPEDVAEAILKAAVKPVRSRRLGGLAALGAAMARMTPLFIERPDPKHPGPAPRHPEGALYRSSESTGVVGRTHGPGGRET